MVANVSPFGTDSEKPNHDQRGKDKPASSRHGAMKYGPHWAVNPSRGIPQNLERKIEGENQSGRIRAPC